MMLSGKAYKAHWGLIFAALFFSSCTTAKVADPSGFLQDYSALKDGTYFKQELIAPGIDFSRYKAVKVAPVNLSYLDGKTSCDTAELENLGTEFREDIEAQLKAKGFVLTSSPGENVLVISLALTNIEPPDALTNAGLTAVSIMTPFPASVFDKDGMTSFEGRITDGATGKELIEFAEERSGAGGKISVKTLTVGKYQKFTNTEAVFTVWSQTIAKMLTALTQKSSS